MIRRTKIDGVIIEINDGDWRTRDVIELDGELRDDADTKHKAFCKRVAMGRFDSGELLEIYEEKKEMERKKQKWKGKE